MDIDIDFADRKHVLDSLKHVPARMDTVKGVRNHNSGVYFTEIPYDSKHQCASIDYETAEERGYFKIDFLNMHVYNLIKDTNHYTAMQNAQVPWERLWEDVEFAQLLVHVGNHTNLLQSMRPDSITRMAAFISVIRPGKAHLQNKPWDQVFDSVFDGDNSKGFIFKKSHAISYAALVALHMNLIHFAD
jgi:hypothetical protein